MNDKSKCVVLVPVARYIEPQTDDLLKQLAGRGYDVRYLRGASMVDLARSTMATQALRDGYEETFWIDSDMAFDPDDVDKIRSHKLPICAGMYPCKGPKRFAGKLMEAGQQVIFGEGGGLIEVDKVGFGFVHIRRQVYEAIMERTRPAAGGYDGREVIPFFRPMISQGTYLSEDFSFCTRAAMAGFSIKVDTTIKLGHIGNKTYTWDDLASDEQFDTVTVVQNINGAVELFSAQTTNKPTGVQVMTSYRETLLSELASLEQQEAGCNEGIVKADAVKADNANRLNAIHGAKSMVQHLLKKLDDHQQPTVEEIAQSNNEEGVE